MGNSGNKTESVRKSLSGRRGRFAVLSQIGLSILLLLALVRGEPGRAEQTNRPGNLKFQSALQSQMHPTVGLPIDKTDYSNRIMTALALCVAFALPLVVPRVIKSVNERAKAAAAIAEAAAPAEVQKAFVEKEFVTQFATQVDSRPDADAAAANDARRDALEEFFRTAPDLLGELRSLFARISRSPDPAARRKSLDGFYADVEALKMKLAAFELIPAWQVASGLEKLLEQLADKAANITPSTLRTAAGALVLLEDLCIRGIRTDLAGNPPVRFLAVDDDPISRRAVSMSLKKVAQAPDMAEHGEAALQLAAHQTYDAVFLDVEMPGLDGFEVCTKLHELATNQTTPVVFVTSHSDFESRSKSASSGGRDLIAKPFLSSEITLKALTLLLRGRLERDKTSRESEKGAVPVLPRTRPTVVKPQTKGPEISLAIVEKEAAPSRKTATSDSPPVSALPSSDEQKPPATETEPSEPFVPSAKDHAEAFAVHGVEHLREMRKQVAALGLIEETAQRQDLLGDLYVGLNLLRSEAARAGLKVICELASGMGKLIAKLLDKPTLFTPSALQAIDAAITLLEELSNGGIAQDLTETPIRVLVVDDDPLARRGISNALQLTFGKPDNAEDGKTAVTLTEAKSFDVIFLDILMPEMDGFETCSKIRETKLNGATPIIFVSSQQGNEAVEKSSACGGNGFISKPVLPAEIFLTAQTFGMRARMGANGKTAPAASSETLEVAVC